MRRLVFTFFFLGCVAACGSSTEPNDAEPVEPGDIVTPADCATSSCAVQIALNRLRACALLGDGTVSCWGAQGDSLTGLVEVAESDSVSVPTDVDLDILTEQLSAGMWTTCARSSAGEVQCWGTRGNPDGDLGDYPLYDPVVDAEVAATLDLPEPAIQVAVGTGFMCALLESRAVVCRGANQVGQLGRGVLSDAEYDWRPVEGLSKVTRITAGAFTACAQVQEIKDLWQDKPTDQRKGAYCWGDTSAWQIHKPYEPYSAAGGRYPASSVSYPVPLPEPLPIVYQIDQLEAGRGYSMGMIGRFGPQEPVELWWWGTTGSQGQRGPELYDDGSVGFTVPMDLAGVVRITLGELHAIALDENGHVFVWGDDWQKGILGLGEAISTCDVPPQPGTERCFVPTQIAGVESAVQIGAGFNFACALTEAGDVYCWGKNDRGQLGIGTTDDEYHAATKVEFQ